MDKRLIALHQILSDYRLQRQSQTFPCGSDTDEHCCMHRNCYGYCPEIDCTLPGHGCDDDLYVDFDAEDGEP